MENINDLKSELENLKKELFEKGFISKELLFEFKAANQSKFDRYYELVELINNLEWESLSEEEKAQKQEQKKLSKLKREGKL